MHERIRFSDTFKGTDSAAGLLDDPLLNEATYALQQAIDSYAGPRHLRRLFVLIVRTGFPVGVAFDTFHAEKFSDDKRKVNSPSPAAQKIKLLQELQQYRLPEGRRSLQQHIIPVPDGFTLDDTDLERVRRSQLLNRWSDDIDLVSEALQHVHRPAKIYFERNTFCLQGFRRRNLRHSGASGNWKDNTAQLYLRSSPARRFPYGSVSGNRPRRSQPGIWTQLPPHMGRSFLCRIPETTTSCSPTCLASDRKTLIGQRSTLHHR